MDCKSCTWKELTTGYVGSGIDGVSTSDEPKPDGAMTLVILRLPLEG